MRKTIYSIITMIYLLVATGVGFNVHYCMGEISSVEFHDSEKKKCDRCGMEEREGGCCNNQKQFYKYDHFSKTHDGLSFPFSDIEIPVPFLWKPNVLEASTIASIHCFNTDKPDPGGPPIYLRNNVFRL